MKAVLPFSTRTELSERLRRCQHLSVTAVDPHDDDRLRVELSDAEILLHVLQPVTAQVISDAPKLRLIQKIGVGTNTIDIDAARSAGIAVANMPGTNTQAVAEHTLALMLATLRSIIQFHGAMLSGHGWSPRQDRLDSAGELSGRTVGLIGFGAVPNRLARILDAMGCQVIFCSRSPRDSALARQVELDVLLETSDVVSLHLPSTPQTRRLIDRAAMERMKHGAILINTARGDLVDERCLVQMLRTGHLRAAGLDVFEYEPVHDLSELVTCPTITLTPHIAWLTTETIERSLEVIVENSRRLKQGRALLHQVA